jgi:hypothetical protein
MTLDAQRLPARPFFSCSAEGLVIVDAGQAAKLLGSGSLEPWMDFKHGVNNIIDTVPRKVVRWDGDQVTVECDGGTVRIDFAEGQARKVTTVREFVYLGTLEERNEGRGYIAVS